MIIIIMILGIRKYMVVLDGTYESSLAFDRTLRFTKPGDELLLVTIIEEEEVEKILRDQGAQHLPAYHSLKSSKADDLAEGIQQRYRSICDERGVCIVVNPVHFFRLKII